MKLSVFFCFATAWLLACFVALGCSGSGSNSGVGAGWTIEAPATVTHASPSTRIIPLTLKSSITEHFVQVELDGAAPEGWTIKVPPTPIHLDPPAISEVAVNVEVTIPSNVTIGSTHSLAFKATETGGQNAGNTVSIGARVLIAAVVTGIREVIPFQAASSVFESQLEINWGEATPHGTLMAIKDADFGVPGHNGPGDAVVWFTPKSGGISLEPGDVETVTIKVLPTTNVTERIYRWTTYFGHTSGEYGVAQQFAAPASIPHYTITNIDYQLGVLLSDPDQQASYTVKFSFLPPGRVTFSAVNVPGRFSATVSPPFVDLSSGETATVRVDVTRTASGTLEDTEEFVLRMTHSHDQNGNASVKFPIQSWLGR